MSNPGAAYVPMSGNGSMAVNSQLVPVPMWQQFLPNTATTPRYYGNGQPPPTIPISYITGNNTDMSSNLAASNPWSPTQSPLPITIAALLIGFFLLRFVHWR